MQPIQACDHELAEIKLKPGDDLLVRAFLESRDRSEKV